MFDKLRDRRLLIYLIFLILFVALVVRLSQLTIMNGDEYRDQSVNKRLKKIPLIAKRGEIYDRNGVLLAGNMPAFTVHLINNEINSKEFNDIAIKIIDILDETGEDHLDFPIVYDNGVFYFKDDKEKWDMLERFFRLVSNEEDIISVTATEYIKEIS